MSALTVVHYSCKPASIPLKQNIDNGATNVYRGMPQKTGYADGTNTFAKGRQVFTRASTATAYLIDPNGPQPGYGGSAVRVDSHILQPNGQSDPYITTPTQTIFVDPLPEKGGVGGANQFSFSTLPTGWSIHRQGPTRSYQPLVNGKQNQIMSSAELVARRKNNAIGRGSIPGTNASTSNPLSFNANNLYGSHTNFLETTNARRRCRNSGYVVPPKCRVGPIAGPYIQGTNPANPGTQRTGNCGHKGGWPATPLLNTPKGNIREYYLTNQSGLGVVTASKI